jgi:D-alanyl-D-alanine carboxypeptidase/D-alanyl-D-alanine-endopeptidase (penicillin-binding protein 4)
MGGPAPARATAVTPAATPTRPHATLATAVPLPLPTAPPAPTSEPPAAAVGNPDLRARLEGLLDLPGLPPDTDLGVSVVDGAGAVLFDDDAERPLLPASTQKLVVAAGALAVLGPDHRFTTELRATAEPDAAGVLRGDLVLVGGGDPALATPQFTELVNPDRPRTPLETLANAVSSAGITRVTGRVIGDPTILPDQPEPAGWLPGYTERGDGTRSSGLTVDAGRRLFVADGGFQSTPAADPALQAAVSLHGLLLDLDVTIEAEPAAASTPVAAPVALAAVDSPTVRELLRYTVETSDNHMADGIFRAVGLAWNDDGTWAGSAAAHPRALELLELDWSGAVLADGSGLSRDDRLTPAFLTKLDARMTASNFGDVWDEVMAVAGESGTLRRRLRGTLVDGLLRGKTGSLSDVRSLSGSIAGPDGRRYHFAVVGNGLDGEADQAVRLLQDEVALALGEDLYGCVRVPIAVPGTTPTGAAPGAFDPPVATAEATPAPTPTPVEAGSSGVPLTDYELSCEAASQG